MPPRRKKNGGIPSENYELDLWGEWWQLGIRIALSVAFMGKGPKDVEQLWCQIRHQNATKGPN